MIMSNSLAAMRPELVCEWSDKNLPLTPDKITYGSNKIVWWKAACGHEWQTSVSGLLCTYSPPSYIIILIHAIFIMAQQFNYKWTVSS